jgi:hypothetical protein
MIFKKALATSNPDLVFKGSAHKNLEKKRIQGYSRERYF